MYKFLGVFAEIQGFSRVILGFKVFQGCEHPITCEKSVTAPHRIVCKQKKFAHQNLNLHTEISIRTHFRTPSVGEKKTLV